MIERRSVLRLLSLSALSLAAAPALAACGGGTAGGDQVGGGLQLVSSDVAREPGDPAAVAGVVAALHRLGGGVLGSVGGAGDDNVAVSPYSIGVAMALTLNGARGTTLAELAGLFDGAATATVDGGLDALTTDVQALAGPQERGDGSRADVAVASANALFGQRGERWEQPFLDALGRSYGAGMHVVDYETDVGAATAAINGWTADRTAGRITDIIPAGALDTSTRLVLVNALYLKASWEVPFDDGSTADGAFTRADGTVVTAPMMHRGAGPAPYGEGPGWRATTQAYAGGGLAMTVVVPDEGRLDAVTADLVAGRLPRYLAAMRGEQVELTLPRFTFRTQASLVGALRSLGVRTAFDPDAADFSAMTTQEDLYVGDVLHQVLVAVDEHGTEAAAATAVVMEAGSAQVVARGQVLVVDRPFLFVVHDVAHGTPLFLGRVADPTAT